MNATTRQFLLRLRIFLGPFVRVRRKGGCLLLLLLIISSAKVLFYKLPFLQARLYYDHINDKTAFFSMCRGDRSGAAVHDMLMAHAYAFSRNQTYGGACIQRHSKHHSAQVKLVKDMGLSGVLKFSYCQAAGSPEIYREFDSSLMTEEWQKHLQSGITYPPSQGRDVFRIVAHVRRGDVNPCGKLRFRYLPNQHFLELIQVYKDQIMERSSGKRVEVTIFSESQSFETWDAFREKGYRLNLDNPLEQVWAGIVAADVVIMSKSSFSFVPSLLNPRGKVIYTPFWHKPLPKWHIVNEDLLKETDQALERLVRERCPPA